ncbi:lamin tail domain-containing protein [Empedobacter brevis]|uniref:LTD domain-containing protein n=2 Tax=Empedobacter brevis TaxID=247 RepID=A0A511NK64_9FLAO|nr:lamin tail domain-containing protein [Empedobacter brevis]GEM53202.1 hypothetical protein EB1_29920 [Empedobacter brevis NBRC 14943 = ATCC 43319]
MKKYLFFSLAIFSFVRLYSQVAITEVFFDTPHMEYQKEDPLYHHAGEFIELYNYTTEDINIGDWVLGDDEGGFIFPKNTIIKSKDYLVIVYTNNAIKAKNANYFVDFFPNAKAHSSKIIYTDKIILNNFKESVSLFMTTIRGQKINTEEYYGVRIDGISWNFKNKKNINGIYSTSDLFSSFDYYKLSYHKNSQEDYRDIGNVDEIVAFTDSRFSKANPFGLYYTPPIVKLEDIPYIKYALYQYEHFGAMTILPELFNLKCNSSIPLIGYSIPQDTYTKKKCFNYDKAGNYISSSDLCLDEVTLPKAESRVAVTDYNELFFVSPNPTNGKVNISWDQSVEHSLSQIHIVPFNGSNAIQIKFNPTNATANYDLTTYPKGIYFVEFILENGQRITKKIIKL